MYCLDTLYLYGNPIVNTNAALAKIENNQNQLYKALDNYFNGSSTITSSIGAVSMTSQPSSTSFSQQQ